MYRQQERLHTSSIYKPGLIRVSVGQKVRYAVIKGGVRRKHLEAPVDPYLFRAHSQRPVQPCQGVIRLVEKL